VTARRPPFAGAAPLPTAERRRTPFVGAAPAAIPDPVAQAPRAADPAPSRLAPFARSETAPRPSPTPAPAPAAPAEAKREQPATPLRPVPLAAVAPPVGGFAPGRSAGGRRAGRPLPKGLLAASLLVLAGLAAVAAVVVLKPWASHPSAVDALAVQSAKPAPLTITRAPDPSAANAATQPAPTPTPATTAVASLTPRVVHPTPAAASTSPSVSPPPADAAAQPGSAQPAVAAPPKAAPLPIVVSVPPEMDAKPAAAPQPEPVKITPPPAKGPSAETISTSHLPGDTVGPHQ
jgi:hypothetical protein